jgi:hypothetical protein
MKKFLAATLVVGALGAGTAAVAAISPLGIAGAQTSTPAPASADAARPLDTILSGLVADGTLTQPQADAVKARIKDYRADHHPVRAARKDSIAVAAATIGVDPKDLVTARRAGQSIADVAAAHNVGEQTVIDAVVTDLSQKIDQAVTNGTIKAERAAAIKARLPEKVKQLVEATGGHQATQPATTTTAG